MSPVANRWLLLRILLPLFLLLALDVRPQPVLVSNGLAAAGRAEISGLPGAAAAYLRGVLELQPWRADLWERAGLDALAAGEDAEGVQALEQARAAGKIDGGSLAQMGDAYARLDQSAQAVDAWRAALAAGEPLTPLYERIYASTRESGGAETVMAVLQDWHNADPADARVLYRLGLYQMVFAPEQAGKSLDRAAQVSAELSAPASVASTNLASALLEPAPAARMVLIGRALANISEWALAATAFERAVSLDASNADAWALWGEAKQQCGLDGQSELKRALTLAPNSVLVRALNAVALRRAGLPDQALLQLQAAAKEEPENGIWRVEIGNTQVALGDLGAAMDSYLEAVRLDPKNPLFWRALAGFSISYSMDLEAVGLPAARKAVALDPQQPASLDVLGLGLAAVGDQVSAERSYLMALEKTPNYAPALLHLGMLYLEQGQAAKARTRLDAAAGQSADALVAEQAQRIIARYFVP